MHNVTRHTILSLVIVASMILSFIPWKGESRTVVLQTYTYTTTVPVGWTTAVTVTMEQGLSSRDATIVVATLILAALIAGALLRACGRSTQDIARSAQPGMPSVAADVPTKFCRHCGANIPRDSTYCEECGARLGSKLE